jgi:hypothetical protein
MHISLTNAPTPPPKPDYRLAIHAQQNSQLQIAQQKLTFA